MQHGTKKSPTVARRERNRMLVSEAYLKGMSFNAISVWMAKEHGISIGTLGISKLIDECVADWAEARQQMIDDLKAIEIQKINQLELTYWQAWEASKAPTTTTTKKTKPKPPATGPKKPGRKPKGYTEEEVLDQSTRETTSTGEPRFLQGVQWCIEKRVELLGYEKARDPKINTLKTGDVPPAVPATVPEGMQAAEVAERVVERTRRITFKTKDQHHADDENEEQ